MALIDQIEKAQGQALVAITDSQKRALELNEKVADAVKGRMPAVKLPFAAAVPSPIDGVKLYFDFAGKLLASNRKFAEGVLSAWVETPKASAPKASTPKATTSPVASKPAVKRATKARTRTAA